MITITQLINTCPAPVSTAEEVTNSLTWFDLVYVFCNEETDTTIPTRFRVGNDSAKYADETRLMTTEYNELNNKLMHIKCQLNAILNYLNG